MKTTDLFAILFIGSIGCSANPQTAAGQSVQIPKSQSGPAQSPVVELLTATTVFNSLSPALSTLTAQAPQGQIAGVPETNHSFTVKLAVNLQHFEMEKQILEIPNVLSMRLRKADPLAHGPQNYRAFPMPDGSVPVLEATVVLHSSEHPDWQNMTIGFPLGLLKKTEGVHEIVLNFTGATWSLYVDGTRLDNDFAFGFPQWVDRTTWQIDPQFVRQAAVYRPGIKPEEKLADQPKTVPEIQYWTPSGHNAWVGDVATFFHQGRYHIFYLYDRRHHKSKFGQGGHYFEHLSTADFKTWTEHDPAVPIEEQWECIGTGTPFVFNGKFCLAYGLHTHRLYKSEDTMGPAQSEFLKANGVTGSFSRATTAGFPVGATYSISEDGIAKFKKTGTVFHHSQNPSVYTDQNGKLAMVANFGAKGIWESDSVDGGWHCISPDFPPGGDCTFPFHWGNFDYIIGGFKGLWTKPAGAPNSEFRDVVAQGLDFYDGSNVPAITEIAGGRYLMAAWIPIRGWGGPLVLRELIQFPDGRIGSKWMPEVTPVTESATTLADSVSKTTSFSTESSSFMLSFTVQPAQAKQGKFAITFLPEIGDQNSGELQMSLEDLRAQFARGSLVNFAPRQKSLREGNSPAGAGNYAIENLIGVDRPFPVRIIVKFSKKMSGSLIDVEMAGQRTMIDYRSDLAVKKILVRAEAGELKDLQIAPLKN